MLQRGGVEGGALVQLHERQRHLAATRILQTDDRGILHRGMPVQHLLDLAGEHVLARDDQHLLDATRDEQVAILVETAHVAGAEEAVLVEHLRRLLGQVPVAVHHVGALDADLAILAGRQHATIGRHDAFLHIGQRPTHAAMTPLARQAPVGHGAGLGESVALGDANAEALLERGGHRIGQRLAATHGVAKSLEALLAAVLGRRQRVVHAWNRHERRHRMLLRQIKHLARQESRRVHRLARDHHRQQREHGQAEAVELRQHAKQHVVTIERRPADDLVDIGVQIAR